MLVNHLSPVTQLGSTGGRIQTQELVLLNPTVEMSS